MTRSLRLWIPSNRKRPSLRKTCLSISSRRWRKPNKERTQSFRKRSKPLNRSRWWEAHPKITLPRRRIEKPWKLARYQKSTVSWSCLTKIILIIIIYKDLVRFRLFVKWIEFWSKLAQYIQSLISKDKLQVYYIIIWFLFISTFLTNLRQIIWI